MIVCYGLYIISQKSCYFHEWSKHPQPGKEMSLRPRSILKWGSWLGVLSFCLPEVHRTTINPFCGENSCVFLWAKAVRSHVEYWVLVISASFQHLLAIFSPPRLWKVAASLLTTSQQIVLENCDTPVGHPKMIQKRSNGFIYTSRTSITLW